MEKFSSPLIIGNLSIFPPLLQAPMAGFTNNAFRKILHEFRGVGLYATEMMHARGLLEIMAREKPLHTRLYGIPPKKSPTEINAENHPETLYGKIPTPLAVQLWDNDPGRLAQITEKLREQYEINVFDLNFGCPEQDVVMKSHCGSWLLQFPEKIEQIVRHVVTAADGIPVTAKIRLGFHKEDFSAPEVAQAVEAGGGSAITVHGRTAEQMYSGKADWEKISQVKSFLRRIPLIGNGDISSPEDALRALRDYHVQGVMIGRAALSRPWIFRQTAALLCGGKAETPSLEQQKNVLQKHFSLLLEYFSPPEAIIQMRKFAPRYGAGLPHARHFRARIATMRTPEEFQEIVNVFFDGAFLNENASAKNE
ncbi:MAG: tRNA-dihydrouridine synthase [Planctomycetia bacterium]|nr:tRNA-dihydrouridine synthase [Planctomycetia bacterium]